MVECVFKVIDIYNKSKIWKSLKHEFCTNQICYRKLDAVFKFVDEEGTRAHEKVALQHLDIGKVMLKYLDL